MALTWEWNGYEWSIGEFPEPGTDPETAYDMLQPTWLQVVRKMDELDAERVAIMAYGLVYKDGEVFGSAGTIKTTFDSVLEAAGSPSPRQIGITAWLQRLDIRSGTSTKHFVTELFSLENTPHHITGITLRKI